MSDMNLSPVVDGEDADQKAIAEFVRTARKKLGMTGAEFGAAFGRTKGAVSHWELGIGRPNAAMLLQIAARSGIPIPQAVQVRDAGFGADALQLLRGTLVEASQRLPATLLHSLKVPGDDLKSLADFLVMLDDLLSRYPSVDG